jgi:hypothetical protein
LPFQAVSFSEDTKTVNKNNFQRARLRQKEFLRIQKQFKFGAFMFATTCAIAGMIYLLSYVFWTTYHNSINNMTQHISFFFIFQDCLFSFISWVVLRLEFVFILDLIWCSGRSFKLIFCKCWYVTPISQWLQNLFQTGFFSLGFWTCDPWLSKYKKDLMRPVNKFLI